MARYGRVITRVIHGVLPDAREVHLAACTLSGSCRSLPGRSACGPPSTSASSLVTRMQIVRAHQTQIGAVPSLKEQEQDCWSCHHRFKKGGIICTGCDKLQPLDTSLDYFELMNMPIRYKLDLGMLDRQYKSMLWKVHPDRLEQHSQAEKLLSADSAQRVNMAYSVLRNPLSRANYMLAQRGFNRGTDSEETIDNPEFLMEVMEAREEVEDTDDTEALRVLLVANRQRQQEIVQHLGIAFDSPTGIREAMDLTIRLTYLARLESEVLKKLPLPQ